MVIKLDLNLRRSNSKTKKRHYFAGAPQFLKCSFLSVAVICLVLLTWVRSAESEQPWHDVYSGHGTTHEQLGQAHYPSAELTPYESRVRYTTDTYHASWAIVPAFNFSHFVFDHLIFNSPPLPRGYIQVKNGSTLTLGPKAEENNWSDLLSMYWLVLVWLLLLVILIILLPFIAVCYFCFCCCRRCKKGCGPCDAGRDFRKSVICVVLLLLLLIFLLIFAIVAFTSNRILDRGLSETTKTVSRGSDDTCRYLHDISEHIEHLFIYNYEELETHLIELLNNAHNHIFLDLADTSESNAIEQLERIFDNMKEARTLMKQVDTLEKDLRFHTTQLRDGVRGVKRDVNYVCSNLMETRKCKEFLAYTEAENIDMSPCLHLDKVPDTTVYVEGMDTIIKDEDALIPKRALERYRDIGKKIEAAMTVVIPPMINDVTQGRDKFRDEATKVRNLIDAVISDVHLRTIRSTQSFEDIYDRLGDDRSYINTFICVLLFLIVFILLVALICGCCFRKGTGATCLLIAIIVMFVAFSFILLVGMFYFMLGLVTYQGACAPLRDQDQNAFFRELDSSIDLNRLIIQRGGQSENMAAPMRMSTAIKACQENQTVFDLLSEHKLYDVEDMTSWSILTPKDDDEPKDVIFNEDLSTVYLLSAEEKVKLDATRNGNLSEYHSILYLENLCKTLTPNLAALANGLRNIANSNDPPNSVAATSLKNQAYHLDTYNFAWTSKIHNIMAKMKQKLLRIDELILYENRNFSDSVNVLLKAITRSEEFLKTRGAEYINALGENLTEVVNDQVEVFIQTIIHECNENVGRCGPLAYIYYRGVDLICYRLVDPLNGFWVGALPAALLLLPLIFLAHKLMCLWRRMHGYAVAVVVLPEVGGCPTCTGAPYVPPPVITCSGGFQAYCPCSEGEQEQQQQEAQQQQQRTGGGGATDAISDGDTESTTSQQPSIASDQACGSQVGSVRSAHSRRTKPAPVPPMKRKKD